MNVHGKLVYNAGCFFGEEKEFLSEINSKYGDVDEVFENYLSVIDHAKKVLRGARPIDDDDVETVR